MSYSEIYSVSLYQSVNFLNAPHKWCVNCADVQERVRRKGFRGRG